MQTRFDKPEMLWTPEIWDAYDATRAYCREHGLELRDYGDRFEIYEPTLDDRRAVKKEEIAAARYEAETGGVTVDGAVIATDRGSQGLLTAAVVMARLDPEFKTRWKCADGRFVQLDAVQLRAIGDAVTAHVEACFAREAELCELIDAVESPEALAAIVWSM